MVQRLNLIVLIRYGLFWKDKITINRIFTLCVIPPYLARFIERLLPSYAIPFRFVTFLCCACQCGVVAVPSLLIRKEVDIVDALSPLNDIINNLDMLSSFNLNQDNTWLSFYVLYYFVIVCLKCESYDAVRYLCVL